MRTGPLDFRDGPSRRGGDVRYRNLVRRVGGAKRSSRQRLQKSGVRRFASDGRMEAGLAGIVTVGQLETLRRPRQSCRIGVVRGLLGGAVLAGDVVYRARARTACHVAQLAERQFEDLAVLVGVDIGCSRKRALD